MTPKHIAEIMILLQDEYKCHNINFVTPEHVGPQVAECIIKALDMGLKVPIGKEQFFSNVNQQLKWTASFQNVSGRQLKLV